MIALNTIGVNRYKMHFIKYKYIPKLPCKPVDSLSKFFYHIGILNILLDNLLNKNASF